MRLRIRWPSGKLIAELRNTPTARQLMDQLPIEAQAHTWGAEVYFPVPVEAELEPDARQVVDPGTLCFWVEGRCLAIPFGPTPISEGDECRLVNRVNILGKAIDDPKVLASVRAGDAIRVELVEEKT